MEKTSKKTASCTLEETLERWNVRNGTTFPVSLFRSKKSGQVLYLEAGKDFVDTLLSFLLLPLGTVHHILTTGIQVKPVAIGISSIFESVQNFSVSDLQVAKEHLMQPRPAAIGCSCRSSGLPMLSALEKAKILPMPGSAHSVIVNEDHPPNIGFVNANTRFIVTDNLEITPLTTSQSVKVLSKLKVDSFADLDCNDITITLTQILQLLNSALTSKNCLNEVLGKSK